MLLSKNRWVFIAFILVISCWVGCESTRRDINIFLLNTEFLFDNLPPHGRIVGRNIPIPTKQEYESAAQSIAVLIDRTVVAKVKSYLKKPQEWQIIFEEGRDTYTGQDVAILTTFPSVKSSITNFPNQRENYTVDGHKRSVRPSKILGVELKVAGQPTYVLITHLISRILKNDAKRLAQATVVRRQAIKGLTANKNVIIMEDMNDIPGTLTIQKLRGFDDTWANMIQTAESVDLTNRFTYIYKSEKHLLDHILISPSFQDEFLRVDKERRCQIFDVDLSDHRAMMVQLRFAD